MKPVQILEERILHRVVLNVPKKPIVFVTDKGMTEACSNDKWYQNPHILYGMFEHVKPVWNADGTIRGAWIYV